MKTNQDMTINNPTKKYHHTNTCVYSCQYHVIFTPKYRKTLLTNNIDNELKQLILAKQNEYHYTILAMEFKIKTNSKHKTTTLKRLMLEGKWLYNQTLDQHKNQHTPYNKIDTKQKTVNVYNKTTGETRTEELKYLTAQERQAIISRMRSNEKTLQTNIKNGNINHGEMKFIRELKSIPLKQYGVTYRLNDSMTRVQIQGLPFKLRVSGGEQLLALGDEAEIANANLVRRPSGWYLLVTVFVPLGDRAVTGNVVGLDFGISHNITTSDGEVLDFCFDEPERLRMADAANQRFRAWSGEHFGRSRSSKRWLRVRALEYERLGRRKRDVVNKVVHGFCSGYDVVCVQDEALSEWHSDERWSSVVQHSVMGGILSRLVGRNDGGLTLVTGRWERTTGVCPCCGAVTERRLELSERSWSCPGCGVVWGRDVASALSILCDGLTGLVASEGVGILDAVNLVSSGFLFFDGSRVRVARVSEQLSLAAEDGLVGSHDVNHDVMEAHGL